MVFFYRYNYERQRISLMLLALIDRVFGSTVQGRGST